jgi:hypothetical protein
LNCYAECCYAACHYDESYHVWFRYAECLAEFRLRRGTHFSSYAESLF